MTALGSPSQAKPILTHEEVKKQSEFIMSRRSEVLDGIKEIDAEIVAIPAEKERSLLERDASNYKAQAARFMPDIEDIQGHLGANESGYYQGLKAQDGIELEVKTRADTEVGELADSVGIDPIKFVSRYEGTQPASNQLADQWRKDELEDIQQNLSYKPVAPQDQYEQLAQAAYDDLHRNALQTYRKAERDLEDHAARKKELYRIAKLIREGRRLETNVEDTFPKTVKETLHTSQIRELEAGKSEAFRFVTQDVDQQRALSRRYLEAEQQDADDPRKLQLSTALAKIDRDTDLAAQQASRLKDKDRGLDR